MFTKSCCARFGTAAEVISVLTLLLAFRDARRFASALGVLPEESEVDAECATGLASHDGDKFLCGVLPPALLDREALLGDAFGDGDSPVFVTTIDFLIINK